MVTSRLQKTTIGGIETSLDFKEEKFLEAMPENSQYVVLFLLYRPVHGDIVPRRAYGIPKSSLFTLGRNPACDLVLPAEGGASRIQGVFFGSQKQERLFYTSLGSAETRLSGNDFYKCDDRRLKVMQFEKVVTSILSKEAEGDFKRMCLEKNSLRQQYKDGYRPIFTERDLGEYLRLLRRDLRPQARWVNMKDSGIEALMLSEFKKDGEPFYRYVLKLFYSPAEYQEYIKMLQAK